MAPSVVTGAVRPAMVADGMTLGVRTPYTPGKGKCEPQAGASVGLGEGFGRSLVIGSLVTQG